ncbi:hypothetical protein [Rhizobium sp. Leaf262]|uniref:hypothetical protein n=1 Tax=Rhizobium sp. Leaf262 TaxID=1736312 RepID=UPI000AF9FE5F|nr:hypothetical protein [Rhizobium sp. Leaf262]
MIFRFLIPAIAVSGMALSGCQTHKPIAMSVAATPTSPNIQHGDVLAPQRTAGQDIPALRGNEIATIRTYEYTKKNDSDFSTRSEIEAVDCVLESDGYKASIKTPAQVRVPDYGYASRPISVRCTATGYRPGVANVVAVNKSADQRMSSGSNAGLAGIVVMAVVNAASDQKKDDFVYPPINVTMNRIGCETSKVTCR